ncbi:DNA methylase [bacterium]|nr:DNA methylase [bacterium]MBU1636264.1 DNA methylase [bacterium]MBU1920254.1 DNA methylase [bacterium]
MAESPAHRFGQIIGEVLEAAVTPVLKSLAKKYNLYLDMRGSRPCREGIKCSWRDLNGNTHDLDFVLERGGTAKQRGVPAAFIETAWRRYTKHSRNKAQEIQGAIKPLVETYRNAGPFIGVILAGVFTEGALAQLRSLGFKVLYFHYNSVVAAFKKHGIDAAFDESTPDEDFQTKVESYEKLSDSGRKALAKSLINAHKADIKEFTDALVSVVSRQIERIIVLPLHGVPQVIETILEAIHFVEGYVDAKASQYPLERYEICIKYNNDNTIEGKFGDKASAVEFLKSYLPPSAV